MKVYHPNEPVDLHEQFLFHISNLFEKSTGHTLPERIAQAISKGKAASRMDYENYLLELKKESWGNITKGYDLIFSITVRDV